MYILLLLTIITIAAGYNLYNQSWGTSAYNTGSPVTSRPVKTLTRYDIRLRRLS